MEVELATKLPRYRLYIDESGDHTHALETDPPAKKTLSLLGAWFRQNPDYVRFSEDLVQFKLEVFGARVDPVILHRNDITNLRGAFGILQDAGKRSEFDSKLLACIGRAQFKAACVTIDKHKHWKKYSNPFPPYHYCMDALLDRYCGWLKMAGGVGDVMVESRGRQEDQLLAKEYERVFETGTLMFKPPHHRSVLTSKSIKIVPKAANDLGLQLADILAHPAKQHCLAARGLIPAPTGVFAQKITALIEKKFNSNGGKIDGYGRVYL